MPRMCFRHVDREATNHLRVPCEPGGRLPVCEECHEPANREQVFQHYLIVGRSNIIQQAIKNRGEHN